MKSNKVQSLKEFLLSNKINFEEDVNLKEYSYFKSGYKVKFLISPTKENEISKLINILIFKPGARH